MTHEDLKEMDEVAEPMLCEVCKRELDEYEVEDGICDKCYKEQFEATNLKHPDDCA